MNKEILKNRNADIVPKDVVSFIADKIKAEKKKNDNRKKIMERRLTEVTGNKNIVIANYMQQN